jgi:uncharacterized protein
MSDKTEDSLLKKGIDGMRRRLLGGALAGLGVAAVGTGRVSAQESSDGVDDLHFPGDEPEHKVVYQFNKADLGYQDHVIFSVGEMLRKYGDNIKIVVVAFAEGIHILGKNPGREVKDEIRQRISSLARYGVEFHACGNTMTGLNWTEKDLVDFAKVVQVGASDLMELQEQGYSYISW